MYSEEAAQLKDDYRRLLQQYADFQKKKEHFEEADNRKFSQVWKMNQEEVNSLVERSVFAFNSIFVVLVVDMIKF